MADSKPFAKFKLFQYDPNLAANVVFTVLFAVLSIWHTVVLIRKRTWYFIPFVIGALFETIGYIGRILAANEAPDFTLGPYIMQSLLILLAPALFAASIYMILARLIRLLGAEQYALIRTNWMTKVFVTGDVLSFFAQGAGGGLLAKVKTLDDQKLGENVILAGLGIQILFFGFFIVTTVLFHVRITKNPTPLSYSSTTGPWRRLILALYLSSMLILVRSVFRMIEFGMGFDGVLLSNEGYLLGLDGALMVLVAVVLLWSHPSKVVRGHVHGEEGLASVEAGNGGVTAQGFQMIPRHGEEESGQGRVGGTPERYDSDSLRALKGRR
ncbi:RTA1 like protein-domain-containing protein [Chaetomium sp. MPI-SDFR-AT-0129]|nr:RTA1 like protein-domain-containing protein [Chaetomium sp. MPI-SDFR-AT-0129]